MSDQCYFVGQITVYPVFAVIGVYNSEDLAVKACRDENYFVMPLTLNETAPHELEIVPVKYPLIDG